MQQWSSTISQAIELVRRKIHDVCNYLSIAILNEGKIYYVTDIHDFTEFSILGVRRLGFRSHWNLD